MLEDNQRKLEAMENDRLLRAEEQEKRDRRVVDQFEELHQQISELQVQSLPTTARAIFDALIMLADNETESTDNRVQVLLDDGAVLLRKAGVTPLAAVAAFSEALSYGNSSAHTVPRKFARQQLRSARSNPSATPLSSDTVEVLEKLLPFTAGDDDMIYGVYKNWSRNVADTKQKVMADGMKYLAALEAPDNDDQQFNTPGTYIHNGGDARNAPADYEPWPRKSPNSGLRFDNDFECFSDAEDTASSAGENPEPEFSQPTPDSETILSDDEGIF